MKFGRKISPKDMEILDELKSKWGNSIKIDFDMVQEPCIFYNYYGMWSMVYKLSASGNYVRNRWYYVSHCHNLILEFIHIQNEQRAKRQITYESEKLKDEQFKKQQNIYKNKGFRDIV